MTTGRGLLPMWGRGTEAVEMYHANCLEDGAMSHEISIDASKNEMLDNLKLSTALGCAKMLIAMKTLFDRFTFITNIHCHFLRGLNRT